MNMIDGGAEVESLFLSELFDEFERHKLKYCVLRNYQQLPKSLGGGDLDIGVMPNLMNLAGQCIHRVAASYGANVIMDYTSSGRMMRLLGCHRGQWWGAAIDLFWSMDYKGVEYLDMGYLINNTQLHKGIHVASDLDATITALVKELLANGVSRKNYFNEAVRAYDANKTRVVSLLERMFKTKAAIQLGNLLEAGDARDDDISRCARKLRRDVLDCSWITKFPHRAMNICCRLRRIMLPPGRALAVLGTDGSGKTTLIDAVIPLLEKVTHAKVRYAHLRPGLIPSLGAVATGKNHNSGEPVTNPHGSKPSKLSMSFIRVCYYAVDYYAGYWLKVYPSMVKRAEIRIFDRYYYDFFLDPLRMRVRLPSWLIKGIFKLAPQPSLILCLGGEAEKIYQRKPETSLNEVARQVSNLKEFCLLNRKAVWIDTTQSIEDSLNQALTAVQRSTPWYIGK